MGLIRAEKHSRCASDIPDNCVIAYDIAFAQTSALIGCRADKSVRMDGMRFMIEMRNSKKQ
jgi:hypothetical protein